MKHRVTLPGLHGGAAPEASGWWHETSNFRKFVPQMLVTIINNLLLMDLSMMLAFPTLVIGALFNNDEPDQDGLLLDKDQASWLGSLVYLCQPLGSVVSGVVTEPLGRRRGMMFVNVPPLIGWLMLRFARSVPALFAANAVLGLSIGFMEAPVLCYVGEISEPRVRSFLTASTGVMAQTGYLLVYLLGATMPWRTAATVCATIPIISFLTMLLVPESPLWLLARGRVEEAQRSLCWLRGWVRPEVVAEELRELNAYAQHTKSLMEAYALPPQAQQEEAGCAARGRRGAAQKLRVLGLRVRDLFRAQTRRPLLLVIAFFFVFHSSGMSGVRPYMVNIILEFGLPVDPLWATVATAVLGLAATALLMAVVARVGKRRLSLASIAGCAVSCTVLGAYAFAIVSGPGAAHPATSTPTPDPNSTFISSSTPSSDPDTIVAATSYPATWVPLTAFIALSFFTYFGVGQIPWMYVAEVYPLRSRGLASGVTAAVAYVLYFTAAKTYLQLEAALTLHGVFWLYAAFGVAGFIFLYLQLPETEGKTLEEVEAYFASKGRKKAKGESDGKDAEAAAAGGGGGGGGGDAASCAPNSSPSYDSPIHVTHM